MGADARKLQNLRRVAVVDASNKVGFRNVTVGQRVKHAYDDEASVARRKFVPAVY